MKSLAVPSSLRISVLQGFLLTNVLMLHYSITNYNLKAIFSEGNISQVMHFRGKISVVQIVIFILGWISQF